MNTSYPNLRTLDWLQGPGWEPLRAAVRLIERKTGVQSWVDAWRGEVVFGYARKGGISLIPIDVPIYRAPGVPMRFDPVVDSVTIDDVIRSIMLCRKKKSVKDTWRAHGQVNLEMDRREAMGQALERSAERAREAEASSKRVSLVLG